MPTRLEKLTASIEKEHRNIDIRRMKRIRNYVLKALEEINAGDFHDDDNQFAVDNMGKALNEADSNLATFL